MNIIECSLKKKSEIEISKISLVFCIKYVRKLFYKKYQNIIQKLKYIVERREKKTSEIYLYKNKQSRNNRILDRNI